jgi:NADPH2:quinone reductase
MKAVRVHAYGAADALRYEDVEVPTPGPGEALVSLSAAGLNFIDVSYRTGLFKAPQLPFVNGSEGAGTVAAVGPGVSEVKAGDRVAYCMVLGSYAEFAVVPAWRLVPVPDDVDLQVAAAVMLQGTTAHYLTRSTFPLKAGDTALVHAAAGGAGYLLTQVARACGARVLATVGSEAKAAIAREAGAHEVIDYSRQDFEAEVKRLTAGGGVDVVYDSVGAATFDKSLNCLRARGYMVLFGTSSGPVPPMDPAILGVKGSLFLTRPGLNKYTATREEILARAADLFTWLRSGALRLRVHRVLPLAEAATAHRELEGRRTTGKVLFDTASG